MPEAAENGRVPAAASAEQRYRDLIEWLPATIYEAEFGPDGEWYYVSPHMEQLLGYTPEEIISDAALYYTRLHPDDRDEVMELERTEAEMARRADATVVSEYRMLNRAGGVVWVRDEARMVVPDGGAPFWRGVLIDITEARVAERALAESHDRYRGLVTSLPVCAYEADPMAMPRRQFLSPQVRDLIGYTPEEWAAEPDRWQANLHPSDRSRVLRDEERHVAMAVGTPLGERVPAAVTIGLRGLGTRPGRGRPGSGRPTCDRRHPDRRYGRARQRRRGPPGAGRAAAYLRELRRRPRRRTRRAVRRVRQRRRRRGLVERRPRRAHRLTSPG